MKKLTNRHFLRNLTLWTGGRPRGGMPVPEGTRRTHVVVLYIILVIMTYRWVYLFKIRDKSHRINSSLGLMRSTYKDLEKTKTLYNIQDLAI